MGKIDEEAARALTGRYKFSKGNTVVREHTDLPSGLYQDNWVMLLHNNRIAAVDNTGTLRVTLAGGPTVTTRSRLNALPGVRVHQHKGEQYLNGDPWDGSWTTI